MEHKTCNEKQTQLLIHVFTDDWKFHKVSFGHVFINKISEQLLFKVRDSVDISMSPAGIAAHFLAPWIDPLGHNGWCKGRNASLLLYPHQQV